MTALTRRTALAAALAAGLLAAGCGDSGGGASSGEVKEFRIGFTATETSPERVKSLEDYRAFLEKELGVPVRINNAPDYSGVAQAMAAGQVDMAIVGPANFATMKANMGDGIEAALTIKESDGSTGYYTVMFVKADSPYRTIDDLKGKTLAFADPNSASGYLAPRYFLRKDGKNTDEFFSKTVFAGGHVQSVVSVLQGNTDAGVTWSSMQGDAAKGYSRGILHQMVADGKLDMSAIRIVWQGGPIPNGPVVMRTSLPKDVRDKVVAAHLKLFDADPKAYEAITQGAGQGFVVPPAGFYDDVIRMQQDEARARRGG